MDDDIDEEYRLLNTRAKSYEVKINLEEKNTTTSSPASTNNDSARNKDNLKCEKHNKKQWTKENDKCNDCIKLEQKELPNGRLPTFHDILCYYVLQKSNGKKTAIEHNITLDLINHWVHCNVYTQSISSVKKRLNAQLREYNRLKGYPKDRKINKYWVDYDKFKTSCNKLFDIIGSEERRKEQEKLWKVKMVEKDFKFYENMCLTPQVGYADDKTCKKWEKTEKRKRKREEGLENKRRQSTEYENSFNGSDAFDEPFEDNPNDGDFDVDQIDEKSKYDPNDELPVKYRHIREGMRSVKPEYYSTIHTLKSEYHLSERQAQGAICTVANNLFGRRKFGKWKQFENRTKTDNNTLPAPTNSNRTEPYFEALVLAGIANEIMSSESSVVTYSNDGSSQSGLGSYTVQSFSIDGKQRALPTLSLQNHERL